MTFVGTLVAVPFLVVRIPEWYFTEPRRHRVRRDELGHPVVRLLLRIGKNLLGVVFILTGVAMIFLPGQGAITILIGITLTDFPGKYRLERWLVTRRPILRTINWLRMRRGKPPLVIAPRSTRRD